MRANPFPLLRSLPAPPSPSAHPAIVAHPDVVKVLHALALVTRGASSELPADNRCRPAGGRAGQGDLFAEWEEKLLRAHRHRRRRCETDGACQAMVRNIRVRERVGEDVWAG